LDSAFFPLARVLSIGALFYYATKCILGATTLNGLGTQSPPPGLPSIFFGSLNPCMNFPRMTFSLRQRPSIFPAILLALVCQTISCPAQSTRPLAVDDIVAKLQTNLDAYEKSIPSFLVDEHMESIEHQFAARGSSAPNYETIAESVFRLKRDVDPASNTVDLKESRDVRIIDGRPANGREVNAPSLVIGAFSGGLAFVSEDERDCMSYTLEKTKPGKPIVVRYATAPVVTHPEDCILPEISSGRVWIDPVSMQISRIEVDVPRHLLTPSLGDGRKDAPTMTHWNVQVVYKPVVLNNRTFWLPATIVSTCSNDNEEWSFRGAYRNYHLLEVHSRIVIPGNTQE